MRSKIICGLAALLLLLGLIGPIVSSQKIFHQVQPQSSSPAEADPAAPPVFLPSTEESFSNEAEEEAADLAIRSAPESAPVSLNAASAGTDPKNSCETEAEAADSPSQTLPPANPEALSNPGSPEQGLRVRIAVVGPKEQLLYGPTEAVVKEDNRWGLSALGALDATGLSYQMSPKYGNFVLSIGGVANQGGSGWMYQVNGQAPMAAADKQKVNPGDQIIWWFSENLNTGVPAWADLPKNN